MAGEQPRADQESPVPAYSWYALGVLFLVYLVNFIDRQILSILANDIKADLGLDDADLGFLYGTAFAIFYALFGIPLGHLADRWSRTRLLGLGLLLWSAMTALSGFARNGATLALARVGVGVGEATASPCAYSLIADWFPQRMRGTALGIYSAGLFLGSGLSLLIGGAVVQGWNAAFPVNPPMELAGWQVAFLAAGAPGLLLALLVFSLREPVRGGTDGIPVDAAALPVSPWAIFAVQLQRIVPPFTVFGAARRGPMALLANLAGAGAMALLAWGLGRITGNPGQFWFVALGCYAVWSWAVSLRHDEPAAFALTCANRPFMAITLAYAGVCFVGYTVTYWAAPYAERVFMLGKAQLGWLLGAPAAAGGFIGVLTGGRLADYLQQRRADGRLLVVLAGVLGPVPLVLIGYGSSSLTVFLICSLLLQIVTSSALSAAAAASQALVPPQMRGTATAIFFLGTTLIGLAFGPFTAGYVSEVTGNLALGVIGNLAIVPLALAALIIGMRSYATAVARVASRATVAGDTLTSG
ncbi:MFS transporter [Altererythrobacter xixiisoli]|uniref:MFS transporter n=2 Tax=Croceibacterium xixiisoli TaxID=1476466 RepID=A0A6I4TZN5_9SPHN|nr:MFS transporter [Croceibacterium xixiisoli]